MSTPQPTPMWSERRFTSVGLSWCATQRLSFWLRRHAHAAAICVATRSSGKVPAWVRVRSTRKMTRSASPANLITSPEKLEVIVIISPR